MMKWLLSKISHSRPSVTKAGWGRVSESKRFLQISLKISLKAKYLCQRCLLTLVMMSQNFDCILWFTYSHSPCSLSTLDLLGLGSHHPGHRIQNGRHTRHPEGGDKGIKVLERLALWIHLVRWDTEVTLARQWYTQYLKAEKAVFLSQQYKSPADLKRL